MLNVPPVVKMPFLGWNILVGSARMKLKGMINLSSAKVGVNIGIVVHVLVWTTMNMIVIIQ